MVALGCKSTYASCSSMLDWYRSLFLTPKYLGLIVGYDRPTGAGAHIQYYLSGSLSPIYTITTLKYLETFYPPKNACCSAYPIWAPIRRAAAASPTPKLWNNSETAELCRHSSQSPYRSTHPCHVPGLHGQAGNSKCQRLDRLGDQHCWRREARPDRRTSRASGAPHGSVSLCALPVLSPKSLLT